jgi:hypothetical protein
MKTCTRKLYDFANVLMTLKTPIIKKVHVSMPFSNNRIAFQYCGPGNLIFWQIKREL